MPPDRSTRPGDGEDRLPIVSAQVPTDDARAAVPEAPKSTPPATPSADTVPKYQPDRPARRAFLLSDLRSSFAHLCATLIHLLKHTLGVFADGPRARADISVSNPGGKIKGNQLEVCKAIAADSVARLATLEQKSTTLLSVIAVVAPLTASAAVFSMKQPLPFGAALITIGLDLLGTVSVLLSFVAVLRALAVRGHQALFLDTVIDPKADRVRAYDEDFYGRGLLYTAAYRQAMCDHIADFVRAAQVFLVIGVALATLASLPVLMVVRDEPTKIEGRLGLDTATVRAIQAPVNLELRARDVRLGRVERSLDSLSALRTTTADLRRELSNLRREMEVRRSVRAKPAVPGSSRQ